MKISYHLPGLFEFYDLYKVFLPLFREHKEYFYDWCDIGSIYGAPADALWGGGRVGFGQENAKDVAALMADYKISSRLTFSNSMLREEHLRDRRCNKLCEIFENNASVDNGVIVHSDLLIDHIRASYPSFYLVSSTTKVLTDFGAFERELTRDEFKYVVADFRLNMELDKLASLPDELKKKVEFLCNECCNFNCSARKECYRNVSLKSLGEDCPDHVCTSPLSYRGYRFSDAMENQGFIGIEDIQNIYSPMGFAEYKIEGRSLGSAVVFEMLLYYMVRPEFHLKIREEIYLDSGLDLF